MTEHNITITLTEDEYNRVQAQLENRDYISDKEVTENEYLANALISHAGLKETKQHYMNICDSLDQQIRSLEKACNIHYSNLMSMKNLYHWIKWKIFNKSVVGNYKVKS